ncbi:MAG: helix-turn-helix domain-containing protein, partial [Lentisphaeria bacterium]|nr:helix-turn-helix domain-containing protein [Lentisphaeria bacterium]
MAHLSEEERNRLERYLNKNLSFRSIAESIG